jgi:acyl-CoA reductase-like NAD-dependent aldehyde dehydrogenase
MVVKIPELTPLATLECLAAVANVSPPAALSIVSGYVPDVALSLVKNQRVSEVAFVGNTETRNLVCADAATHLANVTLELGGNDAALVFQDAAIKERMFKRIVAGAFSATGQTASPLRQRVGLRPRRSEPAGRECNRGWRPPASRPGRTVPVVPDKNGQR